MHAAKVTISDQDADIGHSALEACANFTAAAVKRTVQN
jgi:hypothetical protein